jgi:hypothetical protein
MQGSAAASSVVRALLRGSRHKHSCSSSSHQAVAELGTTKHAHNKGSRSTEQSGEQSQDLTFQRRRHGVGKESVGGDQRGERRLGGSKEFRGGHRRCGQRLGSSGEWQGTG